MVNGWFRNHSYRRLSSEWGDDLWTFHSDVTWSRQWHGPLWGTRACFTDDVPLDLLIRLLAIFLYLIYYANYVNAEGLYLYLWKYTYQCLYLDVLFFFHLGIWIAFICFNSFSQPDVWYIFKIKQIVISLMSRSLTVNIKLVQFSFTWCLTKNY